MAYHRQQGVDTAIVRIFNSILADEQVLVRRRSGAASRADLGCGIERRNPRRRCRLRREGRRGAWLCSIPASRPRSSIRSKTSRCRRSRRTVELPPPRRIAHRSSDLATLLRDSDPLRPLASVSPAITRSSTEGPDGEPEARRSERARASATASRLHDESTCLSAIGPRSTCSRSGASRRWTLGTSSVEAPGLGALAWEHPPRPVRPARLGTPERRPQLAQRRLDQADSDASIATGCRCQSSPALGRRAAQRTRVRAQATAGKASRFPARIKITDELLWLLGLWVAEGCSAREEAATPSSRSAAKTPCSIEPRRSSERELGLHVVRARRNAKRAPRDLRPLEAAAAPDGVPRLRRQPQAHSRAGSSDCRSRA